MCSFEQRENSLGGWSSRPEKNTSDNDTPGADIKQPLQARGGVKPPNPLVVATRTGKHVRRKSKMPIMWGLMLISPLQPRGALNYPTMNLATTQLNRPNTTLATQKWWRNSSAAWARTASSW